MSRHELAADKLTVEYDSSRGRHLVVLCPFPDDGRDELAVAGTVAELREVVDSMSKLLDDLEESEEDRWIRDRTT